MNVSFDRKTPLETSITLFAGINSELNPELAGEKYTMEALSDNSIDSSPYSVIVSQARLKS
jgi:hypothetical protein